LLQDKKLTFVLLIFYPLPAEGGPEIFKMPKEVDAITRLYDYILWMIPKIDTFPRNRKFTLGDRIENLLLDLLSKLRNRHGGQSKYFAFVGPAFRHGADGEDYVGDIGWKGIKPDYDQALSWFRDHLLPSIKLAPQSVVICPGNHDIDRNKTIGMKPPDTAKDADDWLKLELLENFSRPFEAFVGFCEDLGILPVEIGDQSGYLTGKTEKHGLRFVVINSAWFCRGDKDRDKLWLHTNG